MLSECARLVAVRSTRGSDRCVVASILLLFVSCGFGIAFELQYLNAHKHIVGARIPGGQYLYFCLIFVSLALAVPGLLKVKDIPSGSLVAISLGWLLFFVGVLVSNASWQSIRLLVIVFVTSMVPLILGFAAASICESARRGVLFSVKVVFLIPISLAVVVRLLGPFDAEWLGLSGTIVHNYHPEYWYPRWHFLSSSANFFGFCCAVAFVTGAVAIFSWLPGRRPFLLTLCVLLALFGLAVSGTRAAYIFTIIFFGTFALTYSGRKLRTRILCVAFATLLLSIALLALLNGIDHTTSDLLAKFSSRRTEGYMFLVSEFLASPFSGVGFGGADRVGVSVPLNLFYPGIAWELGVFGLLGFTLIALLPTTLAVCWQTSAMAGPGSFLSHWSAATVLALLGHQLFEFNLFRVSLENALFFFSLGIVWSNVDILRYRSTVPFRWLKR